MIVRITDAAEADLERIGDFIALDNPDRALSFVNEILDRCLRLADAPRGFPLVPRYERSGVRRRPYRDYLIFYRVEDDHVDVLHILNGARDYETILFPPE
ncbi:type II toxin-antitoxin system RelE/ParE family toxin [Methylobacterium sp. J-078]|uniref:type II toxin-antitoxin system RelE/ParE family toxin n=1 Tax=Methylobacterium sp. J-078 TaxID=2836657 RepID=UPI001FBAC6AE|nr:type II toxin-antitoxin system RelE/ParE family toxin [Methylobacterium sp. J-078]MCJ2045517.1 type II toxin-antitoxin system RelE/ParE family toxin [Methylobacterium sp. J-078]